jgi:hypothetical protein
MTQTQQQKAVEERDASIKAAKKTLKESKVAAQTAHDTAVAAAWAKFVGASSN